MTTVGYMRQRYSREIETAPSRFSSPAEYRLWATRADMWAVTK